MSEQPDTSLFGVAPDGETEQKHLEDCLRSDAVRDLVRLVVAPAFHLTAHTAIEVRDNDIRLVEAGRYEILKEFIDTVQHLTGENFSQL